MKKIYFISDMHLGAKYLDDPRAHEAAVVRFLNRIRHDASHLILLGDSIDYWFEYRNVVPRGFVRFFGTLARLADKGVKIYWFTGNHDMWLTDYLQNEIGLTVVRKATALQIGDTKFFLSHGDDVGRQKASYRFMSTLFHSKVCRMLLAALHPRIACSFAQWWSAGNRTGRNPEKEKREAIQGIKGLTAFANEHSKANPDIDCYVFGHLHVARLEHTDSGKPVAFLGDWIKQQTVAVHDGNTISVCDFSDFSEN